MPLRQIPIEVWENVIDQLCNDRKTLLACARVCRGWALRSSLHLRLFRILRVSRWIELLAKPVRRGSWEILPIEVWENVIDQLCNDRETLLACARVCRGWAPRSRLHLQKWLILRRPRRLKLLAKLVHADSWEVKAYRTVTITSASFRPLGLFAARFGGRMPHLETLVVNRGKSGQSVVWRPGEMHVDVFLYLSTCQRSRRSPA